jgi:peroxiredoxin
MLNIGTPIPEFSLPDVTSGEVLSSASLFRGNIGVVAFICNHCPYVQHIREALAQFGRYCDEKGVKMVAISSNDPSSYPDDGPEKMAEEAKRSGFTFPYLFDESQAVAKSFRAACTPEFYVFDRDAKLAYRGQFDESRPRNDVIPTGGDVRAAVDALLSGHEPNSDQKPSIGCSIKWKPGTAPSYSG